MRRARWGLPVVVAALCAAAFAAPGATASEFQSFDLPRPLVDTSKPGGRIEKSRTAPKVNVLLPDGYNPRSRQGYPVLYLLHGANGGTDTWIPGIAKLLAGFPGIVVMPDGGVFGFYTDWWNGGKRGDPAWATYHLSVLRKLVERRYPIRPGRRWHAIGGISMGGEGALRYAAMLPGYFGSVTGFSPAVPDMQSDAAQLGVNILPASGPAGEGVSYDAVFGPPDGAYAEGNSPQALAPNYGHTRIYVTSGNGTNCPQDPINPQSIALDTITETAISSQLEPFAVATRAAGADATAVVTCGVHTFGVWDRAMAAARTWGFFKPVAEHPRRWAYRTIATSGVMWGLGFHFAKPPDAVAEFKRSGAKLSGTGSGRVLIHSRKGCRFSATLPFERTLPARCLLSPAP